MSLVKERTIFAECRAGAHARCKGATGTSECTCWHHIVAARQGLRLRRLMEQVAAEAELKGLWAR